MKPPLKRIYEFLYDHMWLATWIIAIATCLILLVTYLISRKQSDVLSLEEAELSGRRTANVEVVDVGGGFSLDKDPEGAYWIYSEVTFRNTSRGNNAEEMGIIHQAFGENSWTGFFNYWLNKDDVETFSMKDPKTGQEIKVIKVPIKAPHHRKIDLQPGKEYTTVMASQTANRPLDKCLKEGKRFVIASRIDWKNPNGARGCKVTFIELSCPESFKKGLNNRELLIQLIPAKHLGKIEDPPAIWPCPE